MQTTKVHSRETGYLNSLTSIKEFNCLFKVVKNVFIKKISGPGGFSMNTTWTLPEIEEEKLLLNLYYETRLLWN